MDAKTAKHMQLALDEAAELIRESYPKIDNTLFAKTQAWFGSFQHLLTKHAHSASSGDGDGR